MHLEPEVHSGPRQIFKTEYSRVMVYRLNPLTIFMKSSILDILQDLKSASDVNRPNYFSIQQMCWFNPK